MFKRLSETALPSSSKAITITDLDKGKFEITRAAMDKVGFYPSSIVGANLDRMDIVDDGEGNLFIGRVTEKGTAISRNGKVTHKSIAFGLAKLADGKGLVVSDEAPIEFMGILWHKIVVNATGKPAVVPAKEEEPVATSDGVEYIDENNDTPDQDGNDYQEAELGGND
jgi:hypothetical protein